MDVQLDWAKAQLGREGLTPTRIGIGIGIETTTP